MNSFETFRPVKQFKKTGLQYPEDSGNLKAIFIRHGTKFQKMWGYALRNFGTYYQSTRQNIPEDDGPTFLRNVGDYCQSIRQNISEEAEPTLLRNVGTCNNLPVYMAYPPRTT